MTSATERALCALQGLSLGDALGMPTQSMSAQRIHQSYGTLTGLVDAVADQPIAPGMAAGHVTDDTEQALIMANLLIDGHGHIDPNALATRLLDWEDDMKVRGSLDLLGPSTKLALEQVRAGADVSATGKTGTTNGAAMRVAPIGIAHSAQYPGFADCVYESCRVTHDTTSGFQSALLVAAAVSFGIDGMTTHSALISAIALTNRTEPRGAWSPKASVLSRVKRAIGASQELDGGAQSTGPNLSASAGTGAAPTTSTTATPNASITNNDIRADTGTASNTDIDGQFAQLLRDDYGTSVESNESVAVAFALAWRYADDPLKALLTAANLGGDTDTIASICGAMLGATAGPGAFPQTLTDQVAKVSHLDLHTVADRLLELRD